MAVCSPLACFGLNMIFHDKAAHTAAAPHEGMNALDACSKPLMHKCFKTAF